MTEHVHAENGCSLRILEPTPIEQQVAEQALSEDHTEEPHVHHQ